MPSDRAEFRVSRRRALAISGAAAASVLSVGGVPGLGRTGSDGDGDSTPEEASSLERVHGFGVTGDGVRVAVLDPTGFDPGHDALSGRVADIRQFGSKSAVVDGTTHGTAAAAAVSSVAPDARLRLASFQGTDDFRAAIEWAQTSGTDVILAPVAAHGTVASPRSAVFRAARDAVESGSVVVAPTGNAALGHWQGPYAALAGDGAEDRKRLRVRAMPNADGVGGRFVAWLVAAPSIQQNLTLALLRAVDDGDRLDLIAVSRPVDSRLGQRLTADLVAGDYALVVRPAGTGAGRRLDGERTGRVEVTTTTHALASPRPLGSIAAPASVPGVVGVGVVGDDLIDSKEATPDGDADESATSEEAVAPYSGRGPTRQGTVGVDVVASPQPWEAGGRPGTSAAAARTAGTAALVLDARPSLGPAAVTTVLRASAGDVGRPGRDISAGWGRLDVLAAVQRARAR